MSIVLVAAIFLSSQASVMAAPPPAAGATAAPAEAQSIGTKRAKVVAKAAIFGFGGGLVVGLASQVFKKKSKNVFLFGSLGMYAGILLGLYVISTTRTPAPYQGPDTYEDFSYLDRKISPISSVGTTVMAKSSQDISAPSADKLQVNFLNLSF
ncbi:MAG: hypothetical protein ACXVBE_14315 [Bdellovibrionota bacterium]